MLGPTEFRDLVSGRWSGAGAAALRGMLRAAELPYTAAVGWRNWRYDRGQVVVHRVGVPVISVGNLTLGGTGKTPMVRWIVRQMHEQGLRAAIVSRGYGANGHAHNDEAIELRQSLADVPHVQNADRVAAAEQAIAHFDCQAIVLDDGFQHRRLARDLDLVLLDALEPFGYEHVFPRGTLREPLVGLQRAHMVCLSRANTIAADERAAIRRRVAQIAPDAGWCECAHAACNLLTAAGEATPLADLAGRRVLACCGIGNPAGFRRTLADCGADVSAWREFPDHHHYGPHDVAELERLAMSCDAEYVVCTQKDLVKLPQASIAGRPLVAVAIEMHFLDGEEELKAALVRVADSQVRLC